MNLKEKLVYDAKEKLSDITAFMFPFGACGLLLTACTIGAGYSAYECFGAEPSHVAPGTVYSLLTLAAGSFAGGCFKTAYDDL